MNPDDEETLNIFLGQMTGQGLSPSAQRDQITNIAKDLGINTENPGHFHNYLVARGLAP